MMRRLASTMVLSFLIFISFLPLSSKALADSQQLQITSAEVRQIPDGSPRNDYELVITFNRPLTRPELYPARFLRYTYGVKYWIESRTGWKNEPWGIDGVQEGLTRDDNLSYWLTSESSYYPIGRFSYDEEVDRAFRKGNIKSLRVELYKQDKKNPDVKYQLIQTFEAEDL